MAGRMSNGLAFLGGFITGGVTVFVVTAVTVWRPLLDELRDKYKAERERRIVAEDNPRHAYLSRVAPSASDWGHPAPLPDVPRIETGPHDNGPQIGSQRLESWDANFETRGHQVVWEDEKSGARIIRIEEDDVPGGDDE